MKIIKTSKIKIIDEKVNSMLKDNKEDMAVELHRLLTAMCRNLGIEDTPEDLIYLNLILNREDSDVRKK